MTHRDARDIGNEDVFTRRPREVTAIKRLIGSDGRYTSTPRGREFLQLFKKKTKKNKRDTHHRQTHDEENNNETRVRTSSGQSTTSLYGIPWINCWNMHSWDSKRHVWDTSQSRRDRKKGGSTVSYIYIYLLVCSILIMSPGACSTS